MIEIVDWQHLFETNETRKLKTLRWVPMPKKLNGSGYCRLMENENGVAMFGCWCAMLQLAADGNPRGIIPHNIPTISRLTGISPAIIQQTITEIEKPCYGWIIYQSAGNLPETCGESAGNLPVEGKGREGNRREGKSKSHYAEPEGSPSNPHTIIRNHFSKRESGLNIKIPMNWQLFTKHCKRLLEALSPEQICEIIDLAFTGDENQRNGWFNVRPAYLPNLMFSDKVVNEYISRQALDGRIKLREELS